MTDKVKLAYAIAFTAHKGQKDKVGMDYINHPLTVSNNCLTIDEKIVALLHDVLEDTQVTKEDLLIFFDDYIVEAVELLTKSKEESYTDYLAKIKQNKIARKVKIQDLKHNMDISRFKEPSEWILNRIETKYKPALEFLTEGFNDNLILCAKASYSKNHGKLYTFLVNEKVDDVIWFVKDTYQQVYVKEFIELTIEELPVEYNSMKTIEPILINISDLKELIKERDLIDGQNDILVEQSHNKQFAILTNNLQETINFLNTCSSEEFYWVSELFERLSEYFVSQELIDCMERNAKRTDVDCSIDIEHAKEALKYSLEDN